jgi:hypothetical protein
MHVGSEMYGWKSLEIRYCIRDFVVYKHYVGYCVRSEKYVIRKMFRKFSMLPSSNNSHLLAN